MGECDLPMMSMVEILVMMSLEIDRFVFVFLDIVAFSVSKTVQVN